jgi:hypothetical protein
MFLPGDSCELASLRRSPRGLNSRIRKTGGKIMPLRRYTRISVWTHTRLLDGWCVLHDLATAYCYRSGADQKSTVSPMDRPPRSPRNPRLRLRDPPPGQQGRRRLQLHHDHRHPRNPQVIYRPCAPAKPLRPVREPPPVRDAALLRTAASEPRNPHRDLDEHRRRQRCGTEAILESEEPHAGCQCVGHGPLPGDTGSDFRKSTLSYLHCQKKE